MGEVDPQKILDLYIHDYLTKPNLTASAEGFARAAGVRPEDDLIISAPEGCLFELFANFWAEYSAEIANRLKATEQPSSEVADQNAAGDGLPNHYFMDREIAQQALLKMNFDASMSAPAKTAMKDLENVVNEVSELLAKICAVSDLTWLSPTAPAKTAMKDLENVVNEVSELLAKI